jgi:hypothetical protein
MTQLCGKQRRLAVIRFALLIPFVIICIILLASSFIRPANAQTATPPPSLTGLRINAQAAFDGYFKYGEWLPIWVSSKIMGRIVLQNSERRLHNKRITNLRFR